MYGWSQLRAGNESDIKEPRCGGVPPISVIWWKRKRPNRREPPRGWAMLAASYTTEQNNGSFETRFLAPFNERYVSMGRSHAFRSNRSELWNRSIRRFVCALATRVMPRTCKDQKIINMERVLYFIFYKPRTSKGKRRRRESSISCVCECS